MIRLSLLAPLLAAFALGCSSADAGDDTPNLPAVSGLTVDASPDSPGEVADRLLAALEAASPVTVIADIDHAANAGTDDDGNAILPATRVILFGNPALGTPLMQANPQAGLDLPQNMLVYDAGDGNTFVAYNDVRYLQARHGLGDLPELGQIRGALAQFATTAVGDSVGQTGRVAVAAGEGIVATTSPDDVTVTYNRLRRAIGDNPNLTIVAELDHAENAASVGLELRPSKLIVFGNPALGTPLMQDRRTIAIDLPQKMLVYESADGSATVIHNDPDYLALRHGLRDSDEEIGQIAAALQSLANAATGR